MNRARVNLFLFAALLSCIMLISRGGRDFSHPNIAYMPDMAYSAAYESFSTNPNFPDGKTMQRPPAGTIARGQLPLHYEATPEDAVRAGRELLSPFPAGDAAVLSRGAHVFSAFCQQCHGAAGEGDGPVARRGFPPPPSLMADKARNMKDGQIFHILTYGQGNMPPHASQISREDRWHAVAHVRKLQEQPNRQPALQPDGAADGGDRP